MKLSLHQLFPLVLIGALVTGCASPLTANVDHDPAFDFSKVRRIAIQPIDRTVVSTVVISDMQVDRVNQTFADELSRKGIEVVQDNAAADMLMTWHLVTQERMDVRTYNTMSARYTRCWHCGPTNSTNVRVRQYTQGTAIVDLIDPQRQLSVWRSIVEQRLRDLDDEQAAENRAVLAQALFAEFPPG